MATNTSKTRSFAWPIIATLVTLASVVIMFALGMWQLDRAAEKEQRLEQIAKRKQDASVSLQSLINNQQDIRDIGFHATGRLLTDKTFLLDNRILNGRVGYEVLTPLETNDGLILANFGWLPAGATRQDLPSVELPTGLVELTGIVSVPQANPMIRETAEPGQAWPVVIQQTDVQVFTNFLNRSVVEFVMLVDENHPIGFERNWQPVVMPPEKHVAYAIQWFGLAIACFIVFVFAFKKRILERHE